MSGFDLVPVDGGDPVHLPPGETVLGRGPFLGVSDKRVSRQHGLLENLNGQLRLKPIHLNPCFVQSSLSDEPRPLQKDSWHLLRHGDLFSLLPGRFIYQVVEVGGEEGTPRNSQMFDEEELQLSPAAGPDQNQDQNQNQNQNQSPPQEVPTPAAPSDVEETSSGLKKEDSARLTDDDQRDVVPAATRRRVLPAWMMAAVAAPRPSSSQKAPSAVKGGKPPAVSVSGKRTAAAQATPTASSSPVEAELSEEEEERPRKRTKKMSNREEKRQTEKDVPSEEPSRSEQSDDFPAASGKGNSSTRTSGIGESETDKKPENKLTAKESVESNGSSASVQPPSKRPVRTACPYGKDCYRKNPLHFQECSHPGDADYEEDEEDEDDEDRPECPYGTDCYRKNPLHRKEYKHTRRPARAKRRVAKNTPDEDEEDEEDEYDDSFIDDDSEDGGGDDSDYVPPDSDDDGKEDVKRLQREAATFLKRRK